MERIKALWNKRIVIKIPIAFLILIACSVGVSLYVFSLTPNTPFETLWKNIESTNYLIFIYNWIPVALAFLLLFFLTNSLPFSILLGGVPPIVLALVNFYKIFYRQDPFRPWDIFLGGEAVTIVQNFRLSEFSGAITAITILAISLVLLIVVFRTEKMSLKLRIGGFVVMLILAMYANKYIFMNYSVYRSFPVYGNQYNQTDIYNSRGFLFSFLYDLNTNVVKTPEGYTTEEIIAAKAAYTEPLAEKAVRPHVIMIQSESFSEMPLSYHFFFGYGNQNPLENYRELKRNSINGYIIPSGFGGGTADTEFDVLTGINRRDYPSVPYANLLITRNMQSITRIFKDRGYDVSAIHPGFRWFYNRSNVLSFLGFDEFIDQEYFGDYEAKGYYINENETMNCLLEEFKDHLEEKPGTPFFQFLITIQNHGPYDKKYDGFSSENFTSGLLFTDYEKALLYDYFYGLYDCDRELKKITDYYESIDEPVVVVYFGDHMPTLPIGIYDKLMPYNVDDDKDPMRLYTVPYMIWHNSAYKTAMSYYAKPFKGKELSSFYLGAFVLELLGYGKDDPFFAFINDMKYGVPVLLRQYYYDQNYNLLDRAKDKNNTIDLYSKWAYYKLFDERYPEQ